MGRVLADDLDAVPVIKPGLPFNSEFAVGVSASPAERSGQKKDLPPVAAPGFIGTFGKLTLLARQP